MSPTRSALEAALRANPDDLGLHAAYADLLIEEGDPRGEFIRLQLALEAPDLPAKRRNAMEAAANSLLNHHEVEWLGGLRKLVREPRRAGSARGRQWFVEVQWKRGWVAAISVKLMSSEVVMNIARAKCPSLLLRQVNLVGADDKIRGASDLRPIWPVLNQFPVQSLEISMTRFGDDLVDELVRHGPWARLEHLDLSMNNITDDGASSLAACPAVRRMKALVLENNLISPIGAQALAEIGFPVGRQHWGFRREGEYV